MKFTKSKELTVGKVVRIISDSNIEPPVMAEVLNYISRTHNRLKELEEQANNASWERNPDPGY